MTKMLKSDLHIHSAEDNQDIIKYSAKDLIDKAAMLNFNVLAFTLHKSLLWKKKIIRYAKKKGIKLIPGSEMVIEGKDVLVYNIRKEDLEKVKTFDDLRKLKKKRKTVFIIAPHPYFKTSICLGNKLEENIDLFDAIEYSWFYSRFFNFNKKAMKIAKKHNKPIIATSDCHILRYFGRNYTLVDSEKKKTIPSFFNAIKKKKVTLKTKPLSEIKFIIISFRIILNGIIKRIVHLLPNLPKQIYNNNDNINNKTKK